MSRPKTHVVFALLVVAGGVGLCFRVQRAPRVAGGVVEASPPRDDPGAKGLPLLDGLARGDKLDEWTVARMFVNDSPTQQPQLAIELEWQGSGITVWVARKETVPNPPVSTERYALTNGHRREFGAKIPDDALDRMTGKIAERVRRNEHKAPLPPGL